jgi:hypothetical protein
MIDTIIQFYPRGISPRIKPHSFLFNRSYGRKKLLQPLRKLVDKRDCLLVFFFFVIVTENTFRKEQTTSTTQRQASAGTTETRETAITFQQTWREKGRTQGERYSEKSTYLLSSPSPWERLVKKRKPKNRKE